MWLLDKFLKRVIRHGRLVVTDYDGQTTVMARAARMKFASA